MAITRREDGAPSRSYDRVGNRESQTTTVGNGLPDSITYAYDDNDRLQTETVNGAVTTYTYDANGNTRTKSGNGTSVSYTYDDANRLIEATDADGSTTYVYDADGLRVRSTYSPTGGTATTTWYVQDKAYAYAQAIEEYQSEGTGPRRLSVTTTFADDLVSQTRYDELGTPTTRYVQADGFGSTRLLTDDAGNVTDAIDYDAFGNVIARSGTTEIEHLYRGEALDPNTGFYYLRARYYDPSNGRFLTQDTFAGYNTDPRSLHKYTYTHNDPVNGMDPSGHMTLMETSTAQNVVVTGLTRAASFMTSRAGLTATGKFAAELAFEYATGIPVLTSPRGMLRAVRSLRGVVGDLAAGAVKRMKAGRDFESLVGEVWGLTKNNKCFKNGSPSVPPGCFIPDFLVTKAGRLIEVKTSMGAVKKRQFQEFIKISRESGLKMSLLFLKKPSHADVDRLQRWALEVTGETDDLLLSIIHVLD